MRRTALFALITLALVALALPAFAAGPVVSPQKCEMVWDQTPTNMDGTPVTDLLGWRIYTTTTAGVYTGPAWTVLNAAAPNPAAPLHIVYNCKAATWPDGQRYVKVTAVDLALNESAASNEVPFVWDTTTPTKPTGLIVQ